VRWMNKINNIHINKPMTAYQGGKLRLGKRISNVMNLIEDDIGTRHLPYMEPFCGMCGVLRHISMSNPGRKLIATDLNHDVITMWKSLQDGWIPQDTCSREDFEELKNQIHPSAEKGFIGSISCYGNVFMSFYRLHLQPSNRDYIGEAKKSLYRVFEDVKCADFSIGSYETSQFDGKVIYCDPPYKGNGFKTPLFKDFDHEEFWDRMRSWSLVSLVFISERVAPSDFICIWSHDFKASINKQSSTSICEKLFIHEIWYNTLSTIVKEKLI